MAIELELRDLAPDPGEQWRRLLRFVGWTSADRLAASHSVEALFARGPELVSTTYEHFSRVPETAAILGWEDAIDPAHLEERRRFLTIWLARTLGLDTSDQLAYELFRAGLMHAGHGPRAVHVPPEYVTGSIGLVLAAFARYLAESNLPADVQAAALAAWSKLLSVQLDMMLLGYRVGRDLSAGSVPVRCSFYGRLQPLLGRREQTVATDPGARVADVLRKLFAYYPQVRTEVLDRVWDDSGSQNGEWLEVIPAYVPRPGWRVLLNGRDLRYDGGFEAPLTPGDELALFPPGR